MQSFLIPLLIVAAAFLGMEAFAWVVHRYVMHGRLGWAWHRSHHEPREGVFEKNDRFALVFAAPAILLFCVGATPGRADLWWAGLGVTLYGLMYAVVHDGFVHQRWPFHYRPRWTYAKRLVQAHRLHHAVATREGAVSFGFLIAPDVRRLKAELKARRAAAVNP